MTLELYFSPPSPPTPPAWLPPSTSYKPQLQPPFLKGDFPWTAEAPSALTSSLPQGTSSNLSIPSIVNIPFLSLNDQISVSHVGFLTLPLECKSKPGFAYLIHLYIPRCVPGTY